jgi:hypothetical protein
MTPRVYVEIRKPNGLAPDDLDFHEEEDDAAF